MIRRLARLSRLWLPALAATFALGGCVSIVIPANVATAIYLVPVLVDDGGGRMATANGYSDVGWFTNPDNHPAVRPKKGETGPADGTQVHPR